MTETSPTPEGQDAWTKLRRRKVVQWTVAYAAAAATLLQLIQYFGETYGWPPAIGRIAGLALPLALAFVLVLAWFHGDKGHQQVTRPEAGILLALSALVGGTLWWYVARLDPSAWEAPERKAAVEEAIDAARPGEAPERSVAVLPFADMSEHKDQGYFSDGLSEELINLLAQVPGLRVPARTSSFYFKDRTATVAEIAGALKVANVLEGSVRRDGNRVRVTAQLVQADSGYQLWSRTYDHEMTDVFKLQDEIAAAVVDQLKVALSPAPAVSGRRTASMEAYTQYLLGRKYMDQYTLEGFRRGVEAFKAAVALDPNYASGYAGLAWAEATLTANAGEPGGIQRAVAAADRAIALAPDLADGYSARGYLRSLFLWDWGGAREDLDKALSLEPNDAWALRNRAVLYATEGQLPEAIATIRKAIDVDPLSANDWTILAVYLMASGDLAQARRAVGRAHEINSSSPIVDTWRGQIELLSGNEQQALTIFGGVSEPMQGLTGVAVAEHSLGNAKASDAALEELIRTLPETAAYQIATVYAWRGERDRAFEWLDRAYAQRDGGLHGLVWDPLLAPIRADARYKALLKRMNLPDIGAMTANH